VVTGRLAPTPSGHLHLGNALAFGAAWLSVRSAGGRLLLRVEDLDRQRSRKEVAAAQRDDLRWLGLDWDEEVRPQSARDYQLGPVPAYFCRCNRRERTGGQCLCRSLGGPEAGEAGAWRFAASPGLVRFTDRALGAQAFQPDEPVLMRDGVAGYPLAVVVDDGRDGVTEVVRGADLLSATAVQICLGEALGLPRPTYLHVPLLLGPDGKKLSKSHGSTELRALRAAGITPDEVWAWLLPLLGAAPPLARAVHDFDPARVRSGSFVVGEDVCC
jgi:glutamyl/glutaminyl-tRNA synthetase